MVKTFWGLLSVHGWYHGPWSSYSKDNFPICPASGLPSLLTITNVYIQLQELKLVKRWNKFLLPPGLGGKSANKEHFNLVCHKSEKGKEKIVFVRPTG